MPADKATVAFDPKASAAEVLQNAPCGIAVTDADGRILYVNGKYAAWVGIGPTGPAPDTRLADHLTVAGRVYYETHIAPMLRLQGFVREIACHIGRPDGTTLPVILNGATHADASGAISRIDFTIFDATERASYEAELRSARHESEHLAAIVRRSPHAIVRLGETGEIQRWNRGAERMFGLFEPEVAGRRIDAVVTFADRSDWWCQALADCGDAEEVEFGAMLPGGMALDVSLARLDDGRVPGVPASYSLVLRDVTRRKKAEDRLSLMLGEMNHRVKNVLGIVAVIARQTLRGPQRDDFGQRIQALSRAQDMMIRADGRMVPLHDILNATFEQVPGKDRAKLDGPEVGVPAAHVASLSMILHELMTNAMKYGALAGAEGHVAVRWRRAEAAPDTLHLRWQEIGGPPAEPPASGGFGSHMIQSVVQAEFGGTATLEFTPLGLICDLVLVLPHA